MMDFVPFMFTKRYNKENILRKKYNHSPFRVVRDLINFVTPSAPVRMRNRKERGESFDVQCYFVEEPGLRFTEFLI